MENASKALIIAGGVLLSVMMLALIVWYFKNIGAWPETQNKILSNEQKAAFNAQYEIYEKSAMYGVDVISCLNKAKSNNEKYAEGGSFSNEGGYGKAYYIDVYVRIKSKLKESVELYHINTSGKQVQSLLAEECKVSGSPITAGMVGFKGPFQSDDGYTNMETSSQLYDFTSGKNIEKMTPDGGSGSREGKNYYSLRNDEELPELLQYSGNNMRQVITNRAENVQEWSSAIWNTALYDFKQKRFTCDYMAYNTENGLVKEIWFSEI